MTDNQIEKARDMRDKGLSYQKIGSAIGVSWATVRCHLDSAAKQYRVQYRADNVEAIKQYNAQYYQSHKEEAAQYRQDHKEERKQLAKQYRIDHAEEMKRYRAQYYKDHIENIRQRHAQYQREHTEKTRQYRAEHAEEMRQYMIRYWKDHQSERAVHHATRRALKEGALIGATANQLSEIKEIYRRAKEDKKVRCYLCGKLISMGHRHVDHIIPLSKGGQHRPSNLAVACDDCNMNKHTKLPEEIGLLL